MSWLGWCCGLGLMLDPRSGIGLAQSPQTNTQVPAVVPAGSPPRVYAQPSQALHNVWQLSPRVISGSEPENEAAFRELATWGIQTIVSVDGIEPRVEIANRYQLRYVHIPVGYDGIDRQAIGALTRVAREVQGKIYIHCHHGKHRGPAAAAILCRIDDGRDADAAELILSRAGTGTEYPGLWRDVRGFKPLPAETILPPLVERAQSESLAVTMAKLDRVFEQLRLSGANNWQPIAEHPDIDALASSVQLMELFDESVRVNARPEMASELRSAAAEARQFSTKLRSLPGKTSPEEWLGRLQRKCAQCHQRFRNS